VPAPAPRVVVEFAAPLMRNAPVLLVASGSAFAEVPGVIAVTVTVEPETVPVTVGSTAQDPV